MSMTLNDLPAVAECSVAGCSYNDHSHCHAAAVTIAGSVGDAECVTFIPLSSKGGLDKVLTHVGACQRGECIHNSNLDAPQRRCASARGPTAQTASPTRSADTRPERTSSTLPTHSSVESSHVRGVRDRRVRVGDVG